MLKQNKLFFVLFLGILVPAIAQEVHVVKRGETLSEIIYSYTKLPVNKLYNGKLKEITELNPHVKNIDLIYPGQKIYLKPQKEIAQSHSPQSIKPHEDFLSISFDYGFEYLKLKQETDIGIYKAQVILPNLMGATFNADFADFGFHGKFQTVKFKYEDGEKSGSSQLFRFQFGGNYKLFSARFEFDQEPIFAPASDGVSLFTQTSVWFLAGVSDKNKIKSNKETFYRYSFLIGIPLMTQVSGATESQSGFKFDLEGSISREITSWELSRLLFSVGLGVYYQYQSFNANWGGYGGDTTMSLFKTDYSISLNYEF